MKILLDSNVLVAAHQADHQHHEPSLALLARTPAEKLYIYAHALAEFFAVSTRLPHGMNLPSQHALLCVQALKERTQMISLESSHYVHAIERVVAQGHAGGYVYDALHVQSALKAGVEVIYTWNVKHFIPLAAGTGLRILSPHESHAR